MPPLFLERVRSLEEKTLKGGRKLEKGGNLIT